MDRPERTQLGAALVIVASLCFAASGVFVKFASPHASSWMALFASFLIGGLVFIPYALYRSGRALFATRNLPLLVMRGTIAVLQVGALYASLSSITLLEAMLFREMAPLWVPLLSFALLGERMPRILWPVLIGGFIGVALVLHPKLSALSIGYAYGLSVGLLFGIQMILTRKLNRTAEPHHRILFFIYAVGILGSAVPAMVTYVEPDARTIGYLGLAGLFVLASTTTLVAAFAFAPSWLLAPLGYSAVIFSALLDWLVFDTVPGLVSALGMVLVVACGLLMLGLSAQNRGTAEPDNRVGSSKRETSKP